MISEARTRSSRYILIGLVVAVVSTILVRNVISDYQARAENIPIPTPEPMTAVLYAAADIENLQVIDALVRTAITTDTQATGNEAPPITGVCPSADPAAAIWTESPVIGPLQVCMIPSRFVPSNAITLTNIAEFEIAEKERVVEAIRERFGSHYTRTKIVRGAIMQTEFLGTNILPEGFMEVSLGVNSNTSVGGRVRPGHRVDVVVSYETGTVGEDQTTITEVLLQNVLVIAVSSGDQQLKLGQFSDQSSDATYAVFQDIAQQPNLNNTVVLALQPPDAIRLVYMSNFANEVRLLIRRPGDNTIYDLEPVTLIK
ncbi:MAG: hypothetical protein DYG89_05925 [Caldilinea sp. CFX5]|nr:hypothetical protein [Caldilinea sp. CFX5]